MDFNDFALRAQNEVFTEYNPALNALINKENLRKSGTDYAHASRITEENIERFVRTASLSHIGSGIFSLPSLVTTGDTSMFFNKVLCYNVVSQGPPIIRTFAGEAEKVTHGKITLLVNTPDLAPSDTFPAYTISETTLQVYPDAFHQANAVDGVYIRYPKAPKWTYVTLVNGDPIFDPSQPDYQDFEVGEDEFSTLVINILKQAGLSIRELEVVQTAMAEELKNTQNPNG